MASYRASMQVTPATHRQPSETHAAPSASFVLLAAVVSGLGVGALTAYGQGWLGDSTSSLANSAGPWSLAAFVVARYGRRVVPAVAAATVTLACSEVGYALATEVRGGSNATSTVVFWLTAAVLAGPPLGIAAAWSRRRGALRCVGFGVIAGVLVGEGIYGWTTVADTTDWRYWAVELIVGVGIAGVIAVRSRQLVGVAVVAGSTAMTAIVVFTTARLA